MKKLDTQTVHADSFWPSKINAPLVAPIVQSSVFTFDSIPQVDQVLTQEGEGYIYSRYANPNVTQVEQLVAKLEQAETGVACGSGMGATAAALFSLCYPGSHVVSSSMIYGGTRGFFDQQLAPRGVEITYADPEPVLMGQAIQANTKVMFVETIANPTMEVADFPALAKICRARGIFLLVDNTFASPYLCQPLQYGVDGVVHSATKYLNGHGDVMGGVVVGSSDWIAQVRKAAIILGAVLDPFAAWLICRGIKTLALRMKAHSANAQQVVEFLANHPQVEQVYYPGFTKQHQLADQILPHGKGGMVSMVIKGDVNQFLSGLSMIRFAPSLADVETTLSHPASTSHRGLAGIDPRMIRLSIGIEDSEDIIADLQAGLGRL